MIRLPRRLLVLLLALLAAGCSGRAPAATVATSAPTPTRPPTATPAPTATAPAATEAAPPAATRTGSDYVLRLPREDAVPGDWAMNPLPDFQTRSPRPGDTYRFACRDLPARSIGVATVGYRRLEGLPSVDIEYVIYGTAEDAAAALPEMRDAAATCGDFLIGSGDNAIAASLTLLDPPAGGDEGFAAALTTGGAVTGELVTHMVKVRQGHVIIGINHTARAGEASPDDALTQALLETALSNLRDGPRPSGPRVAAPPRYFRNSTRLSRIM